MEPHAVLLIVAMRMQIGGLWVLNNDSGRSACYDSLCINTSKLMTRFHDFPMPEHYPMYCTHQQASSNHPTAIACAPFVRLRSQQMLECPCQVSACGIRRLYAVSRGLKMCGMLQILEYLEAYTQHFGFGKSIIFRTEVLSVVPCPNGRFTVSTKVSNSPATKSSADGRFILCNAAQYHSGCDFLMFPLSGLQADRSMPGMVHRKAQEPV